MKTALPNVRDWWRRRPYRLLCKHGFSTDELQDIPLEDLRRLWSWWHTSGILGFLAGMYSVVAILITYVALAQNLSVHWGLLLGTALALLVVPVWAFVLGLSLDQKSARSADQFHQFGVQCRLAADVGKMKPGTLQSRELLAGRSATLAHFAEASGADCSGPIDAMHRIADRESLDRDALEHFARLARTCALSTIRGEVVNSTVGENYLKKVLHWKSDSSTSKRWESLLPSLTAVVGLVGAFIATGKLLLDVSA